MPIYEYECKKCGRIEVIQGFDEAPLTDCPDCNQAGLTKLLSAPAFHLKGSGWYATDFKNAAPAKKESVTETSTTDKADSGGTTSPDKTDAGDKSTKT